MLASPSVSSDDGIKERFIQRLENAMYANQTINVGDKHPIDLFAHYQLGIRQYPNVVVYHNDSTPKNMYKGLNWETKYVDGDTKQAMIRDSQFLCVVCQSAFDLGFNVDDYSGDIYYITKGVNISTNEKGIGGALCIDDRSNRQRNLINKKYPVFYQGQMFDCAIDMYQNKELMDNYFSSTEANLDRVDEGDWLVVCLTEKFKSNPCLWKAVKERGGVYYLDGCTHYRNKTSGESETKYEGEGTFSLYICHLIDAYIEAEDYCDIEV